MGQRLGGMWDRIQGKRQVRGMCDKVFDQCAVGGALPLDKLHLATLLVYDAVNKRIPGRHKDPPSKSAIEAETRELRKKGEAMSKDQFREVIMKWVQRDLKMFLVSKIALALVAGPVMAAATKSAGRQVPRIGNVVDRIPAAALAPAYAVGFVLLQDIGTSAA